MKIGAGRVTGAFILTVVTLAVCGVVICHTFSLRGGAKGSLSYGIPDKNSITVKLGGDTAGRGIYTLTAGATTADLLTQAYLECEEFRSSDMDTVLRNGDEVSIIRGVGNDREIRRSTMSAATRFVLDMAMNLNTATEEELQLVPGIGKKIAKDIVTARQRNNGFRTIDDLADLTALRGLKDEELREYFFVDGAR
jgi:competence protein ComEA